MFFPISSTTRTSISLKGRRRRLRLASSSRGASLSSSLSAGIAATLYGSSSAFSRTARPKATLPVSTATRAAWGMVSWMLPQPAACTEWAPFCLPRPMASIFVGPLSTSPRKAVWGLTLFEDHRVRLVGVLVHKDLDPRGCLPEQDRLHRGPNGASDHLLAHA